MAIIQPDGLFNGQRLLACSDMARLMWPYLFLAANSFGRLEIDYDSIRRHVFVDFKKFPKLLEFFVILREYNENGLLFLYEIDGRVWGQWDCKPGSLPHYKTGKDRQSPEPPAEEYENWKKTSLLKVKGLTNISEHFGNVLKISDRLGVGVGVGVGKESTLTSAKETPQAAAFTKSQARKTFTAPSPADVAAYGAEISFAIDSAKFCDFYAAKGWLVGKSPMKDWRAAVRTWRNNNSTLTTGSGTGAKSVTSALVEKYEREEREARERNADR